MKKSKKEKKARKHSYLKYLVLCVVIICLTVLVYQYVSINHYPKTIGSHSDYLSKSEAENVVIQFLRPVTEREGRNFHIINSYREGGTWKVSVTIDGTPGAGIFEIDARNGKIMYLSDESGLRVSYEDLMVLGSI